MIEPKFVAQIIDFLLEQEIDRNNFIKKDTWEEEKSKKGNISITAGSRPEEK